MYLEKSIIGRFIQKHLIKHFKTIIGPSRELTPDTKNSHYISNGVDVNFFKGIKGLGRVQPSIPIIFILKSDKFSTN